eukprot:TRINITY_DN28451_c0_g2_i1.p1 TRINITY_DN28451_c0_g2~~TRINITY_DN28451_c0_g2_i1.p1  ORF type:complete len:712 (+),score=80.03 TRINITY_DN28451_c0_g2_i1:78-2138(+)
MDLECTRLFESVLYVCRSPIFGTVDEYCPSVDADGNSTSALRRARSITGLLGVLTWGDYGIFVTTIILVLLCVVLATLWVVLCCSSLHRSMPDSFPRPSTIRKAMASIPGSKWLLTPESFYGDVEESLRAEMLEMARRQRFAYFMRGACVCAYVAPVVFGWSVVQMQVPGLARGFKVCLDEDCDSNRLLWQQNFTSQALGPAVFTIFCLFAALCPDKIGPRYISMTHWTVFASIVHHLWDLRDLREYHDLHRGFLVQVRLTVALICGSYSTTVFSNTALLACQITWLTLRVEEGQDRQLNGGTGVRESLVSFGVILTIAYLFEQSLLTQVRHSATDRASSRDARTAKDILNMMCDAVVECTGKQLLIKGACPKLETLTFRQGVGDYLDETSFLHLVSELDRDRLLTELRKSLNATFSMHIHLLDSAGFRIPVQIFVASLHAWNGLRNYVIGIREEGDEGEHQNFGMPSFVPTGRARRQQNSQDGLSSPSESLDNLENQSATESEEAPTELSLSLLRPPFEGHSEASLLWVEPTSSLSIVGYSRAFLNTFGPSFGQVGIDFAAWLPDAQADSFVCWVRSAHVSGQATMSNVPKYPKLILRPPQFSNNLQVCCSISFVAVGSVFAEPLQDFDDPPPAVILRLEKVKYKWRQAARAGALDVNRVYTPAAAPLMVIAVAAEESQETKINL